MHEGEEERLQFQQSSRYKMSFNERFALQYAKKLFKNLSRSLVLWYENSFNREGLHGMKHGKWSQLTMIGCLYKGVLSTYCSLRC